MISSIFELPPLKHIGYTWLVWRLTKWLLQNLLHLPHALLVSLLPAPPSLSSLDIRMGLPSYHGQLVQPTAFC